MILLFHWDASIIFLFCILSFWIIYTQSNCEQYQHTSWNIYCYHARHYELIEIQYFKNCSPESTDERVLKLNDTTSQLMCIVIDRVAIISGMTSVDSLEKFRTTEDINVQLILCVQVRANERKALAYPGGASSMHPATTTDPIFLFLT